MDLYNPNELGNPPRPQAADREQPAIPLEDRRRAWFLRQRERGLHLLNRSMNTARLVPRSVFRWVFPNVCLHCHRRVDTTPTLCPSCWRRVGWIEEPVCARLGTPFAHDMGPGTWSAAAIADPPPFERARAAARYDEVARSLVHAMKFNDRLELAIPLAIAMRRAGTDLLADTDVIVPVPLHRGRLYARRFNQAALLAQALAKLSGHEVDATVLRRVKATQHQVGLSARARTENVRGAFKVETSAKLRISGRSILLVDDVITTGSTIRAATRALLRSGAARVNVLAFAYVIGGEDTTDYINEDA